MERKQLPDIQDIVDNYPEIPEKEYEWMYDWEWYDGPLSGMIRHNENEYWVEVIDEVEWPEQCGPEPEDVKMTYARVFAVLELTQEQHNYQAYWHELYELCDGNEATGKFYYMRSEQERKDLDLTKAKIVGWLKW